MDNKTDGFTWFVVGALFSFAMFTILLAVLGQSPKHLKGDWANYMKCVEGDNELPNGILITDCEKFYDAPKVDY